MISTLCSIASPKFQDENQASPSVGWRPEAVFQSPLGNTETDFYFQILILNIMKAEPETRMPELVPLFMSTLKGWKLIM